ncbi:MAG: hypothetical protein CME62_00065 [Halobacteriovoraceae bacterium]|nr:hypothetical protein [Halobacteriovoraceae bacterium]
MKNVWIFSILFLAVISISLLRTNHYMEENGMFAANGKLRSEFQRDPAGLQCTSLTDSCERNDDCCSKNCQQNVCEKRPLNAKYNGERCSSHKECLSKNCSQFRICAPSTQFQSEVGEFCLKHSGCKTQTCDARSRKCRNPASVVESVETTE